jgi:hypothetical protein
MSIAKSSEVAEVRKLLKETGIQRAKVTLDPLHANPTTLETINQPGGKYIVQIKNNQPGLFKMFGDMAQEKQAIGGIKTAEKSRGVKGGVLRLGGLGFFAIWVRFLCCGFIAHDI